MPLQLNYTDKAGVTHPESYWKILNVAEINRVNERAVFKISGYHNKAAMDAGKDPVASEYLHVNNGAIRTASRVDGNVVYQDTVKTDFTDYLSTEALNPEGVNPYKKAYEFAKAKVPLFASATDVDV